MRRKKKTLTEGAGEEQVLMSPTTEWMARKYEEMNRLCFNGELGPCNFAVEKLHPVSVLGCFRMNNPNIRYYKDDRKLFIQSIAGNTAVNAENFYNLCRPIISLSDYYKNSEEGLLSVLVHEMCHYQNFMYGKVPKQTHGTEFKKAATMASLNSNGRFNVQSVATAEEKQNMSFSSENTNEILRKYKNVIPLFILFKDTSVRLIMAANQRVLREVYSYYTKYYEDSIQYIIVADDDNLKLEVIRLGFSRKRMSTKYYSNFKNNRLIMDMLKGKYNIEYWYK